jgi:transcriptional regulator with XRE-family HTH domain
LTDPENPRILVITFAAKGAIMARVNGHRAWTCSARLAERRHQLGLTQAEIACQLTKHGLPSTNRTVSRVEQGQIIDAGHLPTYAAVLHCTVTYLVGLTEDPDHWAPDDLPSPASPDPIPRQVWILGPVDPS